MSDGARNVKHMEQSIEQLLTVWKPVPGYEGLYEASSFGEIRSLRRGRVLKPGTSQGGYLVVALRKNGTQHMVKVHTVIAAAFLGERPQGLEVNHKDFNRMNNAVENLEYVTRQENIRHARRGKRPNKQPARATAKPIPNVCKGCSFLEWPDYDDVGNLWANAFCQRGLILPTKREACKMKRRNWTGYEWTDNEGRWQVTGRHWRRSHTWEVYQQNMEFFTQCTDAELEAIAAKLEKSNSK